MPSPSSSALAGQPIQFCPADPITAELSALREQVTNLTHTLREVLDTAGSSPAYLPLRKLAEHFGQSPRQMQEIIGAATAAGCMEILALPAAEGSTPRRLYSVACTRAWGKRGLTATRPA